MAVQVPTEEQFREVAAEVGLSLTDADVKSFIELMRPSVAAYNVVDAMPDNLPRGEVSAHAGLSPDRRREQAQCLVRQDHGRRRARAASSRARPSC